MYTHQFIVYQKLLIRTQKLTKRWWGRITERDMLMQIKKGEIFPNFFAVMMHFHYPNYANIIKLPTLMTSWRYT